MTPLQVAMDVDDPSAAIAQLKALGARQWPTANELEQFSSARLRTRRTAHLQRKHTGGRSQRRRFLSRTDAR
jgi:hypothetical protein